MWAMVVKEFRQMRRDHRTLAMMVVMPLMMLVVFGYAASFDVDEVSTQVVGPGAQDLAEGLPDRFDVQGVRAELGEAAARERLRDGEVVAVVVAAGASPARVLVDGSQLFSARRGGAGRPHHQGPGRRRRRRDPGLGWPAG